MTIPSLDLDRLEELAKLVMEPSISEMARGAYQEGLNDLLPASVVLALIERLRRAEKKADRYRNTHWPRGNKVDP